MFSITSTWKYNITHKRELRKPFRFPNENFVPKRRSYEAENLRRNELAEKERIPFLHMMSSENRVTENEEEKRKKVGL